MTQRPAILVVVDTPLLARHLVDLISGVWGWRVEVARTAEEAVALRHVGGFGAALVDVAALGSKLESFLESMADPPPLPTIAMVGAESDAGAILKRHSFPSGAIQTILEKPIAQEDLRLNLHELLHTQPPPAAPPLPRPTAAALPAAPPAPLPAQAPPVQTPAPAPASAPSGPASFYDQLRLIPDVDGFALYEQDGSPSSAQGNLPAEVARLVNFAADVADGHGRESADLLLEIRLHMATGSWLCLVGEDRRLVLAARPGADLAAISRQVHAAS
jgi:hypothetical protein